MHIRPSADAIFMCMYETKLYLVSGHGFMVNVPVCVCVRVMRVCVRQEMPLGHGWMCSSQRSGKQQQAGAYLAPDELMAASSFGSFRFGVVLVLVVASCCCSCCGGGPLTVAPRALPPTPPIGFELRAAGGGGGAGGATTVRGRDGLAAFFTGDGDNDARALSCLGGGAASAVTAAFAGESARSSCRIMLVADNRAG